MAADVTILSRVCSDHAFPVSLEPVFVLDVSESRVIVIWHQKRRKPRKRLPKKTILLGLTASH